MRLVSYLPLASLLAGGACAQALSLDEYGGSQAVATASASSGSGGAATVSSSDATGAGGSGAAGGTGVGGAGGMVGGCPDGSELFADTFTRNSASGWGTSDSMHAYVHSAPSNHSVQNGVGRTTHSGSPPFAVVPLALGNVEVVGTVDWDPPAPTVTEHIIAVQFRYVDNSNFYEARFEHLDGMNVNFKLFRCGINGCADLTNLDMGPNLSPTGYKFRVRAFGDAPLTWFARAWPASDPEGGNTTEGDMGTATASNGPTSGDLRTRVLRTGTSNVTGRFDDIYVCPWP